MVIVQFLDGLLSSSTAIYVTSYFPGVRTSPGEGPLVCMMVAFLLSYTSGIDHVTELEVVLFR